MRAIGWYLVLVGIPAAALLGILKLGETLEPPRAVHGHYTVTFDSSGSGRCLSAVVPQGQTRLTISQSGPRIALSLGAIEFHGTINGDSVRAAAPVADNALIRAANCLTSDTLAIAAALVKTANETRLAGAFTFAGCRTCTAVPFAAARLPDRETDR